MMNYNDNLEESVLGAIIIDPLYLPDVMAILRDAEAFTDPLNRTIFEVIRSKYDNGDSIDLVSLCTAPQLRGKASHLAQLTSSVGSGAGCVGHSRLLVERQMRVKMYNFATGLLVKAESDDDIGDTLSWVQNELDRAVGVVAGVGAPRHISEVISEALNEAEQRAVAYAKGEPVGISTGLTDLDRCTGGWRGGQLIVVAGRPAMGKSAVMLHFAKSAALSDTPVVIFSLEMQSRELGDRLILGGSRVEANGYKVGNIESEEWQELESANAQISRLPISIADGAAVSMQKIRAQCQQLRAKGRCGMVVIDYLQLLDMQGRNRQANREREVAETTRQAKILANELDVPIILLSQLSRKVEERADKTPMLSDLRESGAIEQDADMVVFIHRPYYYDKTVKIETNKYGSIDPQGVGILTVAKQRNGQTGKIYFSHSADLNRIGDYIG
ncbi:MAG: replicative DNA helicase [Rikenellaceae bacterium]